MKNTQRKKIKAILGNTTLEYRYSASLSIADKLFGIPEFISAKCVFVYLSFNLEVDTAAIIKKCFAMGKCVCVPKTDGNEMLCVELSSESILAENSYGIKEPTNGAIKTPDFAIIPLLGFDKNRNRLGRGKGFYDRFLSRNDCLSVALAFSLQQTDTVETQPHDRKPNLIVTEKEIIK